MLSCSDESGTLEAASESDRNFTVFTEIFEKFLEAQPAHTFTDGTSGPTFVEDQACRFTTQPSLNLNGEYYTLDPTPCYYSNDPEDGFEAFSVVSSKQQADGVTVYVMVTFLNMGIPQTGTYDVEYICDDFCYTYISARIYFVWPNGGTIPYFISNPASIEVVNNNGNVTASFDSDFYSPFYPYPEILHGFGNVSCCN